jgi:hypothetical protein
MSRIEKLTIAALLVILCWTGWQIATFPDERIRNVCCADSLVDETAIEDVSASRRWRVFIGQGDLIGVPSAEVNRRVMVGLNEITSITDTRFEPTTSVSGARLKVYPATNEMMWKWFPQWKDAKIVPLMARRGNTIYLTSQRDRWGTPANRLIERAIKHELGHVIGLNHVTDPTSIMNINLPETAQDLNANDRKEFQKRLGKPK